MSTGQAPSTSFRQQLLRRKPVNKMLTGGHAGPELQRSIGTFQLTMFGVGATVGTGIFFVLQEAVPDAGPAVIISFILAGIAAGLSALCYAEWRRPFRCRARRTPTPTPPWASWSPWWWQPACCWSTASPPRRSRSAGAGTSTSCSENTVGWRDPRRAVLRAARDEGDTTGFINLPRSPGLPVRLLLIRGASESAKVNAVMVVIKLAVLVMFVVIGLTAFDADNFAGLHGAGCGRDRRGGRHHLLLLHRPGRCRHGGRGGEGPPADHAEGDHLGADHRHRASTSRWRSPASGRSRPASSRPRSNSRRGSR